MRNLTYEPRPLGTISHMDNKELKSNKTDYLVSALKASSGIIPGAGPILQELISNIIPNQRIDRITDYISILERKICNVPVETIKLLLKKEEFISLIEDGFIQASKSITKERREYIATVIENGITKEEIELLESKHFLYLLSELNDAEIIWLRYYLGSPTDMENNFREKHIDILSPRGHISKDSDEKQWTKIAVKESYQEHLIRLNLIERKAKIDRKTKMPEYDNFGELRTQSPRITTLGKILLKNIGISE